MPKYSTQSRDLELRGDERPMGTKEHDGTSFSDEQRLFPPSTARRSPGRARDSGPVRAQGKQGRMSNKQPGFGVTLPRLENTTDYDTSERPSKRRRCDSQDKPSGRAISISDDDLLEPPVPETSSIAGNSARRSSVSSQPSGKTKRPKKRRNNEYREVERIFKVPRHQVSPTKRHNLWSGDEDQDEQFTENAARERRSGIFKPVAKSIDVEKSPETPMHEIMASVEIYGPNGSSGNRVPEGPPLQNPFIAADEQDHRSDSRESPDELQGEATVKPVPIFVRRGGKKKTSDESDMEEQRPPCRLQPSPSDIRPTTFTSGFSRSKGKLRKNPKPKKSRSVDQVFKATYVRIGAIERRPSEGETVDLNINPTQGTITLLGFPKDMSPIQLRRVTKVEQGEEPSRKIRLSLSRTNEPDDQLQLDMELSSSEAKGDLCALLQDQGARVFSREEKYMDKAFTRKNKRILDQKAHGSKHLPDHGTGQRSPEKMTKPEASKRVKLSDALQGHDGNTAGQKQTHLDTAPATLPRATCNPSNAQHETVEIQVKKYKSLWSSPIRETRSMSRRAPPTTVVCDDGDEDHGPQPKSDVNTEKWHTPLVYPRFGKKKAEVDVQDRERLRDNEFLNDNLIGFYIRFLEDHLERNNKETAKRVYFFNSYFFATLTNWSRGKKSVNYDGVQKWTRNVDIFRHDYIVVPINENAHWYVAIICNLPNLPGVSKETTTHTAPAGGEEPSSRPDSEVREVPETPEPGEGSANVTEEVGRDTEPAKEELTRQSLASMSLSDKDIRRELGSKTPYICGQLSEGPRSSSSPAKASSPAISTKASEQADSKDAHLGVTGSPRKPKKQKRKPPGVRHDVRQPIIITFDSLDLARSPTISILRDYLYAEAKSKRGIEIDKSMIKGMTARGIPLQPNYSDCGLYLLAYVEKFVQDPDSFVRKLLRKEMSTDEDWPPLRSGLLRFRLRNFLDELYDEQDRLNPDKASTQHVMADKQPISFLLGPSAPDTAENKDRCSNARMLQTSRGPTTIQATSNSYRSSNGRSAAKQLRALTTSSIDQLTKDPRTRDQQSSVDAKHSLSRALEPDTGEATAHPGRGEAIEVPHSQEDIQLPDSPSQKADRKKEAASRSSGIQAVRPEDQDIVRVEEDGSVEEYSGVESSAKPQRFKVQVTGTPPPSTGERGSGKGSPRVTKHKPKKDGES
ncbi:hypothetical protein EYZ11_003654 [Aspergillus tanneri]|uniref:Ubiquitin-like protease family profile domain-containing protein n=1 Tax=Aspergillus tanneri TaxID=1220188 RepID=A0A4V3UPY0_9EURO|nr:hypothetical protein EYZ11_003654 [Aspergillus tanneri]